MGKEYDVVIIGSGPAGLTAGLYCGRARLKTAILEKDSLGGAIINIEKIENWPGVEEGAILGADLAGNTLSQIMRYEVDLECPVSASGIELLDNGIKRVLTEEENYTAKAVIVTGGTNPKKIPIKGVDEFIGNGAYHCVLCDGDKLAGKDIAIIGGGDSGVTAALYMSRLGCKIALIEAMENLNACKILQERFSEIDGVQIFCSTTAYSLESDNDQFVLTLKEAVSGSLSGLRVDGVFLMAGREPQTEYLKNILDLDQAGFIRVNKKMETNVPGIFAAGDIRTDSAMQIVTAAGDGATAAVEAEKYINAESW